MDPAVLPKRLIRRVPALLSREVVLQPPRCQPQTLCRDRGTGPADSHRSGLELALRFTQPPLPALRPRDDPLRIKLVQRIVTIGSCAVLSPGAG